MYFQQIGDVNIKSLDLKPAYDLESSLSFISFRAGENIILQVFGNRKVFLECIKNAEADLYKGVCSEEEMKLLGNMYDGGLNS